MLPRKHILTTSILAPLFLLACAPVLLVASGADADADANANAGAEIINPQPPAEQSEHAIIAQGFKEDHHHHHHHQPAAVRKMPPDVSEKFYHYDDPFARSLRGYFSPQEVVALSVAGVEGGVGDMAVREEFSPGLGPRAPHYQASSFPGLLSKRQFSCPVNHYACDSINAPTSCCRIDEQCIEVEDTGMGTAACCPNGSKCEGELKGCNDDQVTCGERDSGECCIKGYLCSRRGCVPDTSFKETSASGPLAPPVPTASCPTGFYSCPSSFNGGCCRVGRGCGMTNCPANTTGLASAVGGDDAKTTGVLPTVPTGDCQTGWASCDPTLNGGCCPTGYACGVLNCPATYLPGILPAETKRMPVDYSSTSGGVRVRVLAADLVREAIMITVAVVMGMSVYV